MTDLELQQWLVAQLPESLIKLYVNPQFPQLALIRWIKDGSELQETEMLHICHLVEAKLTADQWPAYLDALDLAGTGHPDKRIAHADWQTKAKALKRIWK